MSLPPPGGPSSGGKTDPLIGAVVAGRYRVVDRLASGGMGTVYRAEQLGLDRLVALKILDRRQLEGSTEDSRSQDDAVILEKRFSREASMLARLAHPNIVTVFDYGAVDTEATEARRFYMAMELLGGETLQTRLGSKRRLHPDEAINVGVQIARALREAHAHGIVHRDLKPANVMIVKGRDGEELVKLLDFGIGKIVLPGTSTSDPKAELTEEGRFVGSPLYMSPEQIAHGRVDARTDVYSLGVLLYRCIAGTHPFHRDNTALVMLAHLNQEPVPVREKVRDVPVWLDELILRCLVKDPAQRLPSMDELLRQIGEHVPWVSATGSRLTPPIGPRSEAPPPEPTIETAALTPHTHHATTLSAPPTPERAAPPARQRSAFIFLIPAFVLVALLVAVVVRVTRSEAVAPPASSSSVVEPPAPSTFKVTFESTPSGAKVVEHEKVLGETPMVLPIDPATVAKEARVFTIELEGYKPVTIYQGFSDKPVTHDKELAPLVDAAPSATPPKAASSAKKTVIVPPKASATASAPKPPDINLVR